MVDSSILLRDSLLSEAITQDRVVLWSSNRCLRGIADVEGGPVVFRNAGFLLVQGCVDTLSNHKCLVGRTAIVNGLYSLVQLRNNILSSLAWSGYDFVHLTISHLDYTMGESFETNIVSYHDHCDSLSHVKIDQNLHYNVGASSV